jgi:hypothetical protein
MKTHYYIENTLGFGNTYNLYHAPADFVPPANYGWERITRKDAERKAREERRRRRDDPAFSHFASAYILPHDLGEEEDYFDHRRFVIDGVIIRRR